MARLIAWVREKARTPMGKLVLGLAVLNEIRGIAVAVIVAQQLF